MIKRWKIAAGLVAIVITLSACSDLPRLEEALANARSVAESSKVFSADGTLIRTLHGDENRENIPLAQVPLHVRQAVISIEDARFYTHAGVDGRAIARAFFVNTKSGEVKEGGSTITQQLVKNTLITDEKSLKRKVTEAVLAFQFEQKYTKDEILERYLNTVYFGEGAYGIEAAALTYFDRRARTLTLDQGAMLAGVIRSPVRYNPFVAPKEALARRAVVLKRMREEAYITPAAETKAVHMRIGVTPRADETRFAAAYFETYVESVIQNDPQFAVLGKTVLDRTNRLFKGGLRVHTTVDLRLQAAADAASREVLSEPGDPENSFVAIDPKTGHIKALVGGRDYFDAKVPHSKYNLAANPPGRQPGSTFKLFPLIAALERGIPLTKSYRGGSSITIPIPGAPPWPVRNYESLSFGSSLTLREATVKSVNVVYAQLARDLGPKAIIEIAKRMGLQAPLDELYSISLGTEEVTALDLASAYTTLATGGYRMPITPIAKITDARGKTLWQASKTRKKVLAPEVAALATSVLEDVVTRGTGRREQLGERFVAGKTGTSEEYHDAWFAGFTPQMVGVSWVGFPKAQIPMVPPTTRIKVVGGSWPGRIWKLFMEEAMKGLPIERFLYTQDDLVTVRVDTTKNCVATGYRRSDTIVDKPYLKGQEPTTPCEGTPPPQVTGVPAVVGKLEADGVESVKAAGFAVTIRRIYCPAYPSGYVCSQTPSAGVSAPDGSTVSLSVSDDNAVTEVPRVLGDTEAHAREKLEEAGFTVTVVRSSNGTGGTGCRLTAQTASGFVWLQSPCAGSQAGAGTTVRITVNP